VARTPSNAGMTNGRYELAGGIEPPVLIDYLSTDEFATIAVVHHQIINANFVRLVDISIKFFAIYFLINFFMAYY
jgi:hypothetical protein